MLSPSELAQSPFHFYILLVAPSFFKTLLICGAPVLPLPHVPVSSGGIPSLFLQAPLLVRLWRKARVREVSETEAVWLGLKATFNPEMD